MNNQINKQLLFIALFFFFPAVLFSQAIRNPSFEGPSQRDSPPAHWVKCHEYSTPDTQPGSWEVTKTASEGDTYLGLATRGNLGPYANHNEDVQTLLSRPFEAGEQIKMSMDLSYSKKWGHYIGFSSDFLNYDTPAKLQVYGGSASCEYSELLWESPVIDHIEWKTYAFEFTPTQKIDYLILKAAYAGSSSAFGNVLVDNLSTEFCADIPPIQTTAFDTLVCPNNPVQLDASTPGGYYQWDTGSEEASIVANSAGTYTVKVTNGCDTQVFEYTISEMECTCEVSLPNIFTQNKDGVNETFEIRGSKDIARFKLTIFNRWGAEVFETDDVENFWDGTSNGVVLPSGVYYWQVELQCINGHTIVDNSYKGWVTVLR